GCLAVNELRGRNALVTGAGGGLGNYIARALAAAGVNLALTDLPEAAVDGLAEELRARGVQAEHEPGDLTDGEERRRLAAWAEEGPARGAQPGWHASPREGWRGGGSRDPRERGRDRPHQAAREAAHLPPRDLSANGHQAGPDPARARVHGALRESAGPVVATS